MICIKATGLRGTYHEVSDAGMRLRQDSAHFAVHLSTHVWAHVALLHIHWPHLCTNRTLLQLHTCGLAGHFG